MIIAVAEPKELELIGEIFGENWTGKVVITGVGMLNVIRALNGISRDETIVNIGYAGSNTLKPGKWYQVSTVGTNHEVAKFKEEKILAEIKFAKMEAAPCITSTDFVTKTNIKKPTLFDMEFAAIAALGFREAVSLKKVSDSLNYNQYKEAQHEL